MPFSQEIKKLLKPCVTVGKTALTEFVPGTSIVMAVVDEVSIFSKQNSLERLNKLHEQLLVSEKIEENIFEENFSIDDYYTILKKCVQDDEDKKVELYSNLYKSLLAGKVQQKNKMPFIKALSDLSHEEISFLKEQYTSNTRQHNALPELLQSMVSPILVIGQRNQQISKYCYALAMHGLITIENEILIANEGISFIKNVFGEETIANETKIKKLPQAFIAWEKSCATDDLTTIETIFIKKGYKVEHKILDFLVAQSITGYIYRQSEIFIILLNNSASNTSDETVYAKLVAKNLIERCIFIEYAKSKEKKGLLIKLDKPEEKIIFVDKTSSDPYEKLIQYLDANKS